MPRVRLVVVAIVLSATGSMFADAGSKAGHRIIVAPAPAWGTAAETAVVVAGQSFFPPTSDVLWTTAGNRAVIQTGGPGLDWWAPVYVPSGALVTRVQFHLCDPSSTTELQFGLARFTSPGTVGDNVTATGATGVTETPGCALFDLPVITPFTMDNAGTYLLLYVAWSGFGGSQSVASARVFYRLQVSDPPATATFADVPAGSPIRKFVEALYAAGITAGCGNGNFCPNDPITRGQMAVFLASALGLHWPN